ncbi:hypothetical protein TVAG_216400 [Trichomonas vaginalis G3]|uniref:Uncharacterized protein n=1 Tax=Trichomonas vaginalis (strain ATCC PRA-98 / G3) TaxID=412133 RepID=A2ENX4_TRIV3|nr:locomotory exploration behavior [Trichomonas vaginalis G3]EAY05664.1 hypothetical protein TVAG_216400 [Trichomonas vaginalis G3]KAI5553904.1 locomotory exploration behavior [Trichomonas vaginalis G3]|eukprot:XP_001317887.1 hypothetical protein [Trichomonas vaginalis G3]
MSQTKDFLSTPKHSQEVFQEEEQGIEEDYEEDYEESIDSSKYPYIHKIAIPPLDYSGELAVALLILKWVPEYRNFQVLRTDDKEIYEQCGFQFNITDEYDPKRHIYSKQSNLSFPDYPDTLTIAGLIYHEFGGRAIANHYNLPGFEFQEDFDFLIQKLYKTMILPLDTKQDCDISRLASTLDPSDDPDPVVKQEVLESLMNLIEEQFNQRVSWITKTMIPDRSYIRRAMEDRKRYYQTGEILCLNRFVPVHQYHDIIDPDETKKQSIKFVVVNRGNAGANSGPANVLAFSWRNNYRRLGLRGKSGEQLTGLLQNITGTGWVHPNGSCAEWNNFANALEYTKQILKTDKV